MDTVFMKGSAAVRRERSPEATIILSLLVAPTRRQRRELLDPIDAGIRAGESPEPWVRAVTELRATQRIPLDTALFLVRRFIQYELPDPEHASDRTVRTRELEVLQALGATEALEVSVASRGIYHRLADDAERRALGFGARWDAGASGWRDDDEAEDDDGERRAFVSEPITAALHSLLSDPAEFRLVRSLLTGSDRIRDERHRYPGDGAPSLEPLICDVRVLDDRGLLDPDVTAYAIHEIAGVLGYIAGRTDPVIARIERRAVAAKRPGRRLEEDWSDADDDFNDDTAFEHERRRRLAELEVRAMRAAGEQELADELEGSPEAFARRVAEGRLKCWDGTIDGPQAREWSRWMRERVA